MPCDERVVSFIEGEPDSTSAIADSLRVVTRPLGTTPETWEPRERDLPVERYREVRIDEDARPALVRLVGWLAENLAIDERTGNGSWRENRDEVLATAYRLQQPRPADSFTIETVTLDIVNSALKAARRDEDDREGRGEAAGDQPFPSRSSRRSTSRSNRRASKTGTALTTRQRFRQSRD